MIRIATTAAVLAVLAVLTGCSSTGQPVATHAPKPPTLELTATLDSPTDVTLSWSTDVTLSWSGAAAESTSTIVEFATEPEGRYTILDFVAAGQHTFHHPDLMPKTPFYYRATPVLGLASTPVEVHLPAATIFRATTATAVPGSLRSGAGTPTDLAATSIGTEGVRVTWKDNATDEDGYLLEIRPAGHPQYRVVGFTEANSTVTELTTTPAERTGSYRIRAFHRGNPSNVAHQTTGSD